MSAEHEVLVVGGGAAGIAAARRLRDAGVGVLMVEARTRLGGRAWTTSHGEAGALDMGCGWLHSADRNPWRGIAESQGRTIDQTPPPWARATPQPGFPAGQQAEFRDAFQLFRERLGSFDEKGPDRPASDLLEPLSPWNGLLNAISTYYSGAELDRVSARDFARYDDDGVNWRVEEGYGSVVAVHGAGLPARLGCTVQCIDHTGRRLRVETTEGTITADAVILTLPSNLIAGQAGLFRPALPEKVEAAAGLPLGLADKLFMGLSGSEEFAKDSRVFGRTDRAATGAYHFRPFGRPLIEVFFGGTLAADLEKAGETAFFDFAMTELVGLYGAGFARRLRPIEVHRWGMDPLAGGSYSCALPGRAEGRAVLAAPVDDRLFFAGEACSRNDYSTAHGAYLTGIAAADRAIAALRRNP